MGDCSAIQNFNDDEEDNNWSAVLKIRLDDEESFFSSPSSHAVVLLSKGSIETVSTTELSENGDDFSVGSAMPGDSFVMVTSSAAETSCNPFYLNDVEDNSDPYLISSASLHRRLHQKHAIKDEKREVPSRKTVATNFPQHLSDTLDDAFQSFAAAERDGSYSQNLVGCFHLSKIEVPRQPLYVPPKVEHPVNVSFEVTQQKCNIPQETVHRQRSQYAQQLQKQSQSLPPHSFAYAHALLQLGVTYLQLESHTPCIDCLEQAAIIYQHNHPPKPVALARTLHTLGLALTAIEDFESATDHLQRSLLLRYHTLGPWHADTIDTAEALGLVHGKMNNWEAANAVLWQAFWVRTAVFGGRHESVASAAHALGTSLERTGKYQDAAQFYETAWELYEKCGMAESCARTQLEEDRRRVERLDRLWIGKKTQK